MVSKSNTISEYQQLYLRLCKLNGDIYQIDETGMLHKIDDNYTKWNADALLGESHITHIIIEVINNMFKKGCFIGRCKVCCKNTKKNRSGKEITMNAFIVKQREHLRCSRHSFYSLFGKPAFTSRPLSCR